MCRLYEVGIRMLFISCAFSFLSRAKPYPFHPFIATNQNKKLFLLNCEEKTHGAGVKTGVSGSENGGQKLFSSLHCGMEFLAVLLMRGVRRIEDFVCELYSSNI